MFLKPKITTFDKVRAFDGKINVSFNGRTYDGFPKSDVPDDINYLDPLTNYEIAAFGTRYDHVLCPRCYDKIYNRARFGLCASCYNTESHKTLQVVDAKTGKVYLTRRGGKVKIVGPIIRVPVYQEKTIVSYQTVMERPYIDMLRSNVPTDYGLSLGQGKWFNLHSHGALPMEYLLAELD